MKGLPGKCAAVTGGASGIGFAVASRLCEEGVDVAIIDINPFGVNRAVTELAERTDARVIGVVCDVSQEDEVSTAFSELRRSLGRLDLLVVNAGIYLRHEDARAHELQKEVWDRIMSVNLDGAFLTAKHGVRAILSHADGGSVVFVGSPNGLYACAPTDEAYTSSKAGMYGLARVMALDYAADAIRVNIVMPGFTETPIAKDLIEDAIEHQRILTSIPLGRAGQPDEIAAAVVFLLSEDASFITGAGLFVDGGLTVK